MLWVSLLSVPKLARIRLQSIGNFVFAILNSSRVSGHFLSLSLIGSILEWKIHFEIIWEIREIRLMDRFLRTLSIGR